MRNKAKKKKVTMEELAGMVQRGFAETTKKIELDGVKTDVKSLGNNLRILSENNTREHEEIKLRLDNVAYRFELVNLEKRVDLLEKKTGIKK